MRTAEETESRLELASNQTKKQSKSFTQVLYDWTVGEDKGKAVV